MCIRDRCRDESHGAYFDGIHCLLLSRCYHKCVQISHHGIINFSKGVDNFDKRCFKSVVTFRKFSPRDSVVDSRCFVFMCQRVVLCDCIVANFVLILAK